MRRTLCCCSAITDVRENTPSRKHSSGRFVLHNTLNSIIHRFLNRAHIPYILRRLLGFEELTVNVQMVLCWLLGAKFGARSGTSQWLILQLCHTRSLILSLKTELLKQLRTRNYLNAIIIFMLVAIKSRYHSFYNKTTANFIFELIIRITAATSDHAERINALCVYKMSIEQNAGAEWQ